MKRFYRLGTTKEIAQVVQRIVELFLNLPEVLNKIRGRLHRLIRQVFILHGRGDLPKVGRDVATGLVENVLDRS